MELAAGAAVLCRLQQGRRGRIALPTRRQTAPREHAASDTIPTIPYRHQKRGDYLFPQMQLRPRRGGRGQPVSRCTICLILNNNPAAAKPMHAVSLRDCRGRGRRKSLDFPKRCRSPQRCAANVNRDGDRHCTRRGRRVPQGHRRSRIPARSAIHPHAPAGTAREDAGKERASAPLIPS